VQILNEPWPWWGTLRGRPLTVADLVARGTLSTETAAILGWSIQRGASLFVAAGPPGAGKSTLANALLEFLPEDAQVYVTSGGRDPIDVPAAARPLYLLINELSAHMPVYLYGRAARRAFDLLDQGARMIGTLHARSATEALQVMCDAAERMPRDIVAPFVFAAIAAYWEGQSIVRRVTEVGFLPPGGDLILVARTTRDQFSVEPAGLQALADWSGVAQLPV
jgi:type IV secretory pathway ATPase VirB11/archaellum biosynthesis ATPase